MVLKKIGSYGNVIYDSGNDAHTGKQRIGISATEIELLGDIPPSSGTGLTRSGNNVPDQARGFGTQVSSSSTTAKPNNYQTLSSNREQSKSNVVYQDDNNQQLNFAVDQLLEKYAPDALPQNLLNNSNNRRVPPQVNVITSHDQQPVSTFQTNNQPPASTFQTNAPPLPPSSSTASHNYSTIIRPNTGQTPQIQTQINNNNNNNNIRNGQKSTSSRPTTNYDSFQHVIPPVQQQQQQQQPHLSVPIKTKNGNFAQVMPGKLYTLDDDPLHLLYDRQIPAPVNSQQPSFQTTFQPSSNFPSSSQPSTITYTNATQRYPHQSIPITINPNPNGTEPFDLGNLIKRVQQEYLREIQPFVSSVKFVEKDREYGQGLADVGFITPVTVRKGFTRQADDILRRSFGEQNKSRQPRLVDRNDSNTYSEDEDDDINELHSSNRRDPLENLDSKQSFTSVTSTSTTASGSDSIAHYASLNNRKNKVEVHNQGTSPPPQVKQTTQAQVQKAPVASVDVSPKAIVKHESDEEDTTTTSAAPVTKKFAKRVSSGQLSTTSSESTISDDQQKYAATYNEHELPQNSRANASGAAQMLAANVPVVKPDQEARQRIDNRALQRSEDIHPTPPTVRSSALNATVPTTTRTQVKSESEESDGAKSGSDNVTESEDEDQSASYNAQPQQPQQPPPTARSTVAQVTTAAPLTRGPVPPQRDARATTAENPNARARTTTDNNTRQPADSRTNPNIHFVPPDQRSAANDRGAPPTTSTTPAAATTETAQTGSNRFFKSDNAPKSGGKRSLKDGPASIGDRIKSIFRRK